MQAAPLPIPLGKLILLIDVVDYVKFLPVNAQTLASRTERGKKPGTAGGRFNYKDKLCLQ